MIHVRFLIIPLALFAAGLFQTVSAGWKMFLVAGQSNAMGITGDASMTGTVSCDPQTAYEYDYANDQIVHLQDPVGLAGLDFQGAIYGSAWPALARRYHELTGDTVIIVQAARDASSMLQESELAGANWSPTGQLFGNAVTKINAAVALTQVSLSGIVWLQGETDAIVINNGTITIAQYTAGLLDLISRFRQEFGDELPFYIIRIGTDYTRDDAGFLQVRDAQEEVAEADSHTVIVYRNTINFQALGWMNDGIHYNQTGLNNVGAGSADTIVLYEQGLSTDTRSAPAFHTMHRSPQNPLSGLPAFFDIRGRKVKADRAPNLVFIKGLRHCLD